MALPRISPEGEFARFPLDVARVDGTTVVATTMRGIVRVASTRDDGATWTPFTVAFDPAERGGGSETAAHLVTSGRRLLMFGATSAASSSYWALSSDDAGASWHAP